MSGAEGRLTRLDELPRHQLPGTFNTVGSDSVHWHDGYYFTLCDADGAVSMCAGLRLYPNTDVAEAFVCLSTGGVQHNGRWSRRLRPGIDDLAVGPVAVEVVRPLRRVRTTCAPNPHGMAFDLEWRGVHPPYLEEYVERRAAGRVLAQRSNYDQCCEVSGWVEVAGTRHAVGGDRWVGVRDHSWGLGSTGGRSLSPVAPVPAGEGPPPFALRQWVMFRLPRRVVFWQFHRDAGGGYPMAESRVLRVEEGSAGYRDADRDGGAWGGGGAGGDWSYDGPPVELELDLVEGHPRLRSGRIGFRRPDRVVERFAFEVVGWPVYLEGGGYRAGFDDHLGRGVYRGDEHHEGERWDVTDPSRIGDPGGRVVERPDAWAETFAHFHNLADPEESGIGHLECVVAGAW